MMPRYCYYLLLLCLLLAYFPLQAQEKTQVTVHLKNGSVIQGAIITSVFEEYLTIEIDEVTHLEIPYHKISSVYFGTAARDTVQAPAPFEPGQGFVHTVELGLLAGQNRYGSNASLSLNVINGYQFGPHWQAALGAGLDLWGSVTSLPIYAGLQATAMKRKVSPYAFLHTGYALAWSSPHRGGIEYDRVRGGWMLHPGIGYQFQMANTTLLLRAGYKLQKLLMEYSLPDWNGFTFYREERTIRRMSLAVGICF